ncbi:hypothetical protein [Paenibacillus koleovorans]|uniref:hypothetical protein n=1 Tax=Paenibacillus koleovorans TaxID=121608 RepID=UPI000FDC5896|nr:hypothetical protein [Paenibacillus koleovorans]
MSKGLRAAAGKVTITPEEKTGLAGFTPAQNIAHPPEDVLDDLFARILMIDDGRQRSLFVSVDCCRSNEDIIRVFDKSGIKGQYRQSMEMFPYGTRRGWGEAAGVEEAFVMFPLLTPMLRLCMLEKNMSAASGRAFASLRTGLYPSS